MFGGLGDAFWPMAMENHHGECSAFMLPSAHAHAHGTGIGVVHDLADNLGIPSYDCTPSIFHILSTSADVFFSSRLTISDSIHISFANNRTVTCFHFRTIPRTPDYFPYPRDP
ncbi:hypothetical protein EI94DRAFT_1720255 [Lactarius quietus]|nr:hypothetical protein EI94DRAFT_1720255 [Lactarius quietus]